MLTLGLEIMLGQLTSSKAPEGFNDMMQKTYDSSLYGGKVQLKLQGKQNMYKKSWIKYETN